MTLQQFLSKYKDASLSTYEKNLLEQCFDKLNLKYKNKNLNEQNTLIEQDPLYETIVYIFAIFIEIVCNFYTEKKSILFPIFFDKKTFFMIIHKTDVLQVTIKSYYFSPYFL